MREVFVHQDYTRVGFYQSILEEAGIPNLIRNGITHHSLTEIPSPIFYPALCVLHDEDYDRAMKLLGKFHHAKPCDAPDWRCEKCGADVPANFDSCWKCETARSSTARD